MKQYYSFICYILKFVQIRLPVPSLESSIHRYLTAVKPLLKPDEFENTKKLAEDFLKNGIGEKLQKLLVEKSKTTDNWVLILLTFTNH